MRLLALAVVVVTITSCYFGVASGDYEYGGASMTIDGAQVGDWRLDSGSESADATIRASARFVSDDGWAVTVGATGLTDHDVVDRRIATSATLETAGARVSLSEAPGCLVATDLLIAGEFAGHVSCSADPSADGSYQNGLEFRWAASLHDPAESLMSDGWPTDILIRRALARAGSPDARARSASQPAHTS